MIATIFHRGKEFRVDFFKPLDISIPLHDGEDSVRAWYVEPMKLEPVVMGDWVGDVNRGGSVNFRTITFNPHGNGTHTECVGHISRENFTVNKSFERYLFVAELITVLPVQLPDGDFVITRKQLETQIDPDVKPEAVIIRTLGNGPVKTSTNYSNTNPPYMLSESIDLLNEIGVQHLLIDMPSIDREIDGGRLESHHAFWNYPDDPQLHKTITEFIYVPNEIPDGTYLLQMQIAPFENDASPSKPVLYKIFS